MPLDDEPDEPSGFQPPLPPDDRLWRHPSELGPGAAANPMTFVERGRSPRRVWALAGMSFVVGVAGTLGVLALAGAFDEAVSTVPVETVALPVPKNPQVSDLTVAEQVLPAVARIEGTSAAGATVGTAVIYRSDGYLLTSADAVDGAAQITVTFHDGRSTDGQLVGLEHAEDLAVVKVDRTDLATVTLGQPKELELGEKTLVISTRPAGSAPSIGVGLVSGTRQRIDPTDEQAMHGMIMANIRVTPEASGAPLVDTSGAVVGLVTRRGVDGGGDERPPTTVDDRTVQDVEVRYATPIDWAKQVADDLSDDGALTKVWLGVEGIDIAPEDDDHDAPSGARLTTVVEGSPAAAAQLVPGDVVTELDDAQLLSMSDLIVALRERQPGEQVKLTYARNGERAAVLATLQTRPATG